MCSCMRRCDWVNPETDCSLTRGESKGCYVFVWMLVCVCVI